MHTINSYNAKYMKRVLTILPLTALCISTMQAQHKNEYTNFADTTFNIQEVVATAARKPRPQITKLDVPMKYLPISINSITASSLELRGIRNIQDAVRFMTGRTIPNILWRISTIVDPWFRSFYHDDRRYPR